jgi:hypothetical protein
VATRTSRRILWALTLSLSTITAGSAGTARQQSSPDGPVQMTREEDHARTMKQLGLATMPRGAVGASVETYDESKANAYPTLPDPLVSKNGRKVTTAAMWRARRAEILEDFEREVYGRRPKNTPKVRWEVRRGRCFSARARGPSRIPTAPPCKSTTRGLLLGRKDLGMTEFPPIDTTLADGDLGFRQHTGGHTAEPTWPTFLAFAAKHAAKHFDQRGRRS